MRKVLFFAMAMCMVISLSACESSNGIEEQVPPEETRQPDNSGNDTEERTSITLTVGKTALNGYLNNTRTARDLISRLPVTLNLNRGSHDYCGEITPALPYDEDDIQNGWKNGDLAFWTAGNDFVLFYNEEENSSSTGNIVNIGSVTSNINLVRSLGDNINVTVALAEQENDNNQNENDMVTRMKIIVGNHILTATLEDNATAQAFAAKLPITLPMMDLYGREMCYRFPDALPADGARTRGYEVGEIVYYPPMHSFVIMYAQNGERFQMQSIGRVEGNVGIFNGIGDVYVKFEKQNDNKN